MSSEIPATETPLTGLRVLVTRPQHQALELCQLLEGHGATAVPMPTLAIDFEDSDILARALMSGKYDLLLVTSGNTVCALVRAAEVLGGVEQLQSQLAATQIIAVGPRTAEQLAVAGFSVAMVPKEYRAEGLLAEMSADQVGGKRVLFPRAEAARTLLADQLRQRGAQIEEVIVYRSGIPVAEQLRPGLSALRDNAIDVLTFTSGLTAANFATIVARSDDLSTICRGLLVAAIGPVTAAACEKVGMVVDIVPRCYTVPAMVQALVEDVTGGQKEK